MINIREWMNTRLLWWHIKRNSPEVNTSVGVDARNNREDSRAFWSSFSQTSQPKYYCTFILSDNLIYRRMRNNWKSHHLIYLDANFCHYKMLHYQNLFKTSIPETERTKLQYLNMHWAADELNCMGMFVFCIR